MCIFSSWLECYCDVSHAVCECVCNAISLHFFLLFIYLLFGMYLLLLIYCNFCIFYLLQPSLGFVAQIQVAFVACLPSLSGSFLCTLCAITTTDNGTFYVFCCCCSLFCILFIMIAWMTLFESLQLYRVQCVHLCLCVCVCIKFCTWTRTLTQHTKYVWRVDVKSEKYICIRYMHSNHLSAMCVNMPNQPTNAWLLRVRSKHCCVEHNRSVWMDYCIHTWLGDYIWNKWQLVVCVFFL